jgi:hypothetical protein
LCLIFQHGVVRDNTFSVIYSNEKRVARSEKHSGVGIMCHNDRKLMIWCILSPFTISLRSRFGQSQLW